MTGTPKIALLIETARGYGRGLLRGIVRYGRLHGPWSFYVTPGDFAQALPRMRQWGGAGTIARVETPRVAQTILASGLPTVALDLSEDQLRPDNPLSRLSEVASDSHGAARLARSTCWSAASATTRSWAWPGASGPGSARTVFVSASGRRGSSLTFMPRPAAGANGCGSMNKESWPTGCGDCPGRSA